MSEYTPDRWVIIELKFNDSDEIGRRVLAGWYGGYLGSDEWRLSSGITKIIDHDDYYEIHNESGSVYNCGKRRHGMSGYTSQIYKNIVKSLEDKASIKVIEYDNTN